MQTNFTLAQLADPETARSRAASCASACIAASARRPARPSCCWATSATARAGASISSRRCWRAIARRPHQEVRHVDRCLSCLSCMTTCPSGVNYMHLVDHGRHHIEDTYTRPLADRLLRRLLGLADAAAAPVPLGHGAGPARQAAGGGCCRRRSSDPGGATFLRRMQGDARRRARPALPDASPVDRPQTFPAVGLRAQARRADAGLRPAGAGARGQRGDGAAADAARRRGRECRGLGLLRLVGAAYRRQRAGARARQAQHRRLAARVDGAVSTPS